LGIGGRKGNVKAVGAGIMQQQWNKFWGDRQYKQLTESSWSKRRIKNILNKYIDKDMTVLDAGCGSGYFSNYFISKGCNVYSLDYSEKALEIARKVTQNKAVEYLKRDLLDESICFEFNSKFDLIFTDGLFEHFSKEEQENILKAFITIKNEKGLIITVVPNRYSFWTIIRPIFMPGIEEVSFTLKKLTSFAEKLGQNVVECGGLNVLPVKYSPEFLGKRVGMLLYIVSK
jgi:2-polyprenyl-3-methyl-5-hydroxy-6-metoxy-1,4-benzoquinol methylase